MPISDGLISARQLCSNSIDNRHISPDAITPTEVAVGFSFVELVTTLPVSGNFEGRMVYLTTDDKLYRHDGSAFLLAVDGADISAETIGGDKMIANTITAGEIQAGAIGASELAAINIEVGKFIRSTTYTPGSAGWAIDADGTAEFDNIIARGEIDATSGSFGGVDISGILTMTTTGTIRTSATGQRLEITGVTAGRTRLDFYLSSGSLAARIESTVAVKTLTIEADTLIAEPTGGGSAAWSNDQTNMQLNLELFANERVQLENGSAGSPSLTFQSDLQTGIYRVTLQQIGFTTGGVLRTRITNNGIMIENGGTAAAPSITWALDGAQDTGLYWASDGVIGMTANGTLRAAWTPAELQVRGDNGVALTDYGPGTTGTSGAGTDAAWVNLTGAVYDLRRFTSGRKYKSRINYNVIDRLAAIDLRPAKFYRKDDQKWFYGLIADDLDEQDPLLGTRSVDGEIEGFSRPGLEAIMAAKLIRLEAKVAALEAAA